jgi:hypothetical protein
MCETAFIEPDTTIYPHELQSLIFINKKWKITHANSLLS